MSAKNVVLVVLDGWGIGHEDETNPVHMVKPATFARLAETYPITSLQASGIAIGLPWGQVGNSEVGHLTLGAGKVLYQYYPKIIMAIQDGSFFKNPALVAACDHAKQTGGSVNLAGLLTEANIHASIDHLLALISLVEQQGIEKINLHLFADGEDSPPQSLQKFLAKIPQKYLATLMGRYYAMDRNSSWSLTENAYLTMTGQAGPIVADPTQAIEATYARGNSEEYLLPLRIGSAEQAPRWIVDGDSLIFFNYREDSIRQIASSFIMPDFDHFTRVPFQNLYIATMTHYDDRFTVPVAFEADIVTNPIGKVISNAGLTQLRIAETYKYAHVTYFFNGLREPPFEGEFRTLVPSLGGIHPEEHPEMMAKAITDRVITAIQSRAFPFILVNYSNADTMGHSANFAAGMEAVRVLDQEIGRLVAAVEATGTTLIITADHGNIEEMINPTTGEPESQHDPSPVPVHLIAPGYQGKHFINADNYQFETLGSLADIAPTVLELMGMPKPAEMTGDSLLDKIRQG